MGIFDITAIHTNRIHLYLYEIFNIIKQECRKKPIFSVTAGKQMIGEESDRLVIKM